MSEYHVPCPAAPCKSLLLLADVDKHLAQRHLRALENKRVSFVAYHVPTGRQFHRRISLGEMWVRAQKAGLPTTANVQAQLRPLIEKWDRQMPQTWRYFLAAPRRRPRGQ